MSSKFDVAKSVDYFTDFYGSIFEGINNMMSITDDELRSDMLDKELVLRIGNMKLYHYVPTVEKKNLKKTPMLIVYALINRQYMLDLQPDRSFIKELLDQGIDCYIMDWGYPSKSDMYITMEDHIEWYMNDCVDFVLSDSGKDKISLLGICQGGTFSAIYTALHPEKIKNLGLMVTPIDFSKDDGLLFSWSRNLDIDSMVDAYGTVPGWLMNAAYIMLKPFDLILDKYIGFGENMSNPDYLTNFLRMEKWIFDSPDQEGETLREFVTDFYQENKFYNGTYEMSGKPVLLENIKCPVIVACAQYDHLVPPSSTKPVMDKLGSKDKEYMEFPVGHVGIFVSPLSTTEIAPKVGNWFSSRS